MTSRVDMHCHSTASQLSRLGVQRSLGLPECATPPEEVYELAKRRGMDFVTITDHDTIDGCLELADRPDCFVSEELTARFAGEPQAVHVLCYGITPGDHEWLQAHAGDVEACAAYLAENEIASALAHPFYNVDAPLTPRHRRRLAELFPIWEVRNGSRAAELNMPAAIYIETHGGTGIGGSDDHAGVDIGRTFTEVPAAATPEEFLHEMRAGDAAGGRPAGQRGQVGSRGDGVGDARPRRVGCGEGTRPRRRIEDRPAHDQRGRRARGQGRRRHRARRRAGAARGLAALDRARPARAGADRLPAGRGLLPRRSLPPRPPHPRAAPARRRSPAAPRRRARATWRAAFGGLFDARDPGRALRAGDHLPRRREGEAGQPLGGAAADRPDRRRDRRQRTASPRRSRRSASSACRASRSRSSAPTPASTGACRRRPSSRFPSTPA